MPKKNSIRTAKNNKNPKSLTPFQILSPSFSLQTKSIILAISRWKPTSLFKLFSTLSEPDLCFISHHAMHFESSTSVYILALISWYWSIQDYETWGFVIIKKYLAPTTSKYKIFEHFKILFRKIENHNIAK